MTTLEETRKSINGILNALDKQGLRLGLDSAGNLRIRGDKKYLNDSLVETIRKHKEQLVAALRSQVPLALLTDAERSQLGEDYEDAYPMSALQAGMVFHTQLEQFSGVYHDIMSEHVRYSWERVCFEHALAACIHEHPVLRTTFRMEGERPLQLVHPVMKLPFAVEDLRHRSAEEQESYLREWIEARKRHVFDWRKGPLFHINVFRRTEDSFQFVLSFHHSVLDGWSRVAFTTQLYKRYEALLSGHELGPVAVEWTYRDFIAQEQQALADPAARLYFASMLEEAPAVQLPRMNIPGREQMQGQVRVENFTALSDRLIMLAKRLGTPVQSVLLAAHFKVLSTVSGMKRVVSCVTSNGRPEISGADRSLGLFLNSVPLALELKEDSWHTLIDTVAALSARSMEYRSYPLSKIQKDLSWSFSEVLFNYTHFHNYNEFIPGAQHGLKSLDSSGFERTNFDLHIDISRGVARDMMSMVLRYNAQLWDQEFMVRLGQYYVKAFTLMLELLEDPHNDRALLSAVEHRLFLETWNATEAPYPQHVCIHQLFEQQVRRNPTATAVICEQRCLNYEELDIEANGLAHYLIEVGVKPDQPVAICVQRSLGMVIGLLGILKAGGAYVPLDPGYPSQRLGQILGDANPGIVLVDAAGRTALGEEVLVQRMVIDLDLLQQLGTVAKLSPVNPESRSPGVDSHHLAYIIYTSGSTGKPKGVMNEHQALVNRLTWMQAAYRLDSTDVVLQKTSFSFDVSVWEFFWTLLQGATLAIAPPESHKDAARMIEMIRKWKITTIHFVPSMLGIFVNTGGVEGCTSLRRVICSGEALSATHGLMCRQKLPGAQLHNLYGPTEAAIDVTAWTYPADYEGSIVPIGRPIANTQIYLLDGYGQLLPLGAVGEIYIGGVGVARGYLKRPDMTAERFVPDAFGAASGARMYRTGDLARYLADGNIEFLGRNDHQVKIRGFRIELGEIESRLAEHKAVFEAVVVVRESAGGEKHLVAYVVPIQAKAANDRIQELPTVSAELAGVLRMHLANFLPEYMVPAAFVSVKELPLTPNGKLDRHALPLPEGEAYVRRVYEAPQGEMEHMLADLWQDLLGVERVGRQDHFFELGGHSLLAIRLMERLRSIGLQIEIRTLFSAPVLSELAASLRHHQTVPVPPNLIAPDSRTITPEMLPLIRLTQQDIDRIVERVPGGIANIQDIYALSPLQDGILFHHLLASEGDPYLMSTQMVFPTRELLDNFLLAAQQVIDRHDILRTAFLWEGISEPAQVVWRHAPVLITEVKLDPQAGPIAEQLARCFDPRRFRLDLTHAPLLRYFIAQEPDSTRWVMLQLQHHAIEDVSSVQIFRAEIEAILTGRGNSLAPPPPFRNLVAQARLGIPEEEHDRFFTQMLGDISEPTLPFGLIDVRQEGEHIAELHRPLPQTLNIRLRAQARRLGVSLASLFHVAWAQVLSRTCGQERVVFGTVLLGRMQSSEGVGLAAGLFINTLPLRLDMDGTPTKAAVRLAHARLAELLMHEHASLARAQRCSGVVAPSPLFSAILNYRHNITPAAVQDKRQNSHPLYGVEFLGIEERTNYPLTLSVEDSGHTLGLTVLVVRSLSPERVCSYMEQAIESLVMVLETEPDTAVRELEVLSPAERSLLLEAWNATQTEYPGYLCIHHLFEHQVHKTPEAVAVVCGEQSLNYAELNAQANRLAHHLIELGVRPEERVAICVERSEAMVIGLLAILKAGGAYVPLDPVYPSERLRQILVDATPRIVLIDATGREALGGGALMGRTELDLSALRQPETVLPDWNDLPSTNPDSKMLGITSHHLSYVIYTSGSTGIPKGVMIEHISAVNFLSWAMSAFSESETRNTLFSTSIQFDLSVYECFVPLVCGSAVHVVRDALSLIDQAHVVSLVNTVPSAIESLVEQQALLPPLCTINLAGEPLKSALMERIFERSLIQRLCDLYGPTETTVYSTWIATQRGSRIFESIGRPIANTQIYLLDAHMRPVPLGVIGEIFIGGAGVARGYLNRADLTAERFLPDGFCSAPGSRMYKTGDVARYLSDGNIEFFGRNDQQVKIRGFRIELGEIETRLAEHALVREAVVLAREDAEGAKRLVAYVVPVTAPDSLSGSIIDAADLAGTLRAHLVGCLPEYMVPAAFVPLPALPLTPNGKLDRKALPAPEGEAYVQRRYEPPQGEVEQAVAVLWQELLGVERIGRNDHFFELGGHSLLAVRLMVRVRQTLGIEMSMGALFAHPTLVQLARVLAQDSSREMQNSIPAITPASREGVLPLSFAQQALWFLSQSEEVSTSYHLPNALRLLGNLDRCALRRSLDAIFARHEALRSIFVAVDGQPHIELLSGNMGLNLVEEDLRGVPQAWQRVMQLSGEEVRAPFDLARGPLVRARLIRLDEQEYVFLVTHHHIISDGISMGIFAREMGELYQAFSHHQSNPLLPLTIQYPDYAAWQRQWLSGERLQRQTEFWRQTLADAPVLLELPTDRPRPLRQSFDGDTVPIHLDSELTRGLRQLSAKHGATIFITLLTAWAAVLSRLSGQEDLVIGVPTATRARPETEKLIGFFINTLALRVDLRDIPSLAELLRRVRATAFAAQDHQDLSFEQVVGIVQPPRRLNHTPLFQVMFTWQINERHMPDLSGIRLESLRLTYEVARFDLKLDLYEQGDSITGALLYATALFDEATIRRQSGYLSIVLKAMVDDSEQPVAGINLLTPEERTLVLETWNATETTYPEHLCIQQLFEQQVVRTPHAVALICSGQSITYAELNLEANRVAHHLIGLGVKAEERVAICMDRSVGMVIGLLGILKAGGAYVPLDPAYPSQRLRDILVDARPRVVLCGGAGREVLGEQALSGKIVLDLELLPHYVPSVWANQPVTNPDAAELGLSSQHLAYVMYTSGSTGTPKGVMVEHGSVVNFHGAMKTLIYGSCASPLRVGWNASFSFDMSIKGLAQLLSGHCLVVIPQGVRASGEEMVAFIEGAGLDAFDITPSQLRPMIAAGLLEKERKRLVLVGGEAVDGNLWEQMKSSSGMEFHNMYGPTECTVDATIGLVKAEDEVPHIGRVIANMKIYLLDGQGEVVPLGAVGEIYIRGVGVARGYLERPEMTAERFVPDGFSSEAGARMYKTGDVGRYRADGKIEYVGRNDQQVKIRGFRIELGEIEARLREHELIREAVVVAREDGGGEGRGEKRLVSYVVPVGEEREMEAGKLAGILRTYLGECLPEYMVPGAFVRVEEMPLTRNGKLDRKALPEPEGEAYGQRRYEAPQGEMEERLAALWQELLKVERVGRNDHFFELGGHSLLVVQLMVKVRQLFGVSISLRDVFMSPTLAAFAAAVNRGTPRTTHQNLIPVRTSGAESPLFLVHPGGGGIDYVRNICPFIDAEIPVYGLEATGLAPGQEPLKTIEEMAELYLRSIHQVQPHGPYRIAGWSAGGTISYEMARRLIETGEQVDFLGLIDTYCQQAAAGSETKLEREFDEKVELIQLLSTYIDKEDLTSIRELAQSCDFSTLVERIYAMDFMSQKFAMIPVVDAATIRCALATRYAIRNAADNYLLLKLSVPIWLFEARESRSSASIGWRNFLGDEIQVVPVRGTHITVMEGVENLEYLGAAITKAIASAGPHKARSSASHTL